MEVRTFFKMAETEAKQVFPEFPSNPGRIVSTTKLI